MTRLTNFSPTVQLGVRFLSGSASLAELAHELQITKQGVHKKIQPVIDYLQNFEKKDELVPISRLNDAHREIKKLTELVQRLRRELTISAAQKFLLAFFRSQVRRVFPTFHSPELPAAEKKQLLDFVAKFRAAGGTIREFAKAIEKSASTLSRWQSVFKKYGLNGLVPKKKRPKHFGNKLPAWAKDHLLILFRRFPRWTPFQYHSYIRHSPMINWYLSLPTIVKLKQAHEEKTAQEKDRIKKRWAFAPGFDVWAIDFTCLLKTKYFKLQLLTISDQRSRFLFPTALFLNTSTKLVMAHLEELFLKFGKPLMIKADNGQEFRLDCRDGLERLAIYLLNSPIHYGQFNGAHERIHRTIKQFIDNFSQHLNLSKLLSQIMEFEHQYNYSMIFDGLNGNAPADIYFNDKNFIPQNAEVITPYEKDGDLRMKFTDRNNGPARLSMPLIMNVLQKLAGKSVSP